MKKQTAAEKFDLVPPWCVVKTGRENSPSWCVSETVTPADGRGKYASTRGKWCSGDWFATEPEARRIARLTRPLDSWEPAEDCPLPVGGWKVCPAGGGWIVAHQPDTQHAWFNVDPGRVFDTRRAAIVWAWTEAEAPDERKPITDGTGATDGLEARVSKVEGVLARICPEADSQVDGKGRTLVQINRELDDLIAWRREVRAELDGLDRWCDKNSERMDNLIAAHVPVPAKANVRSDAASTNEAMTEAAASDEGWREMLVTRSFDGGFSAWLFTPSASHFVCGSGEWSRNNEDLEPRKPAPDTDKTAKERRTCKPPPNLAEWYKPGHVPEAGKMVDDTADRAERLDTLASLRSDVRAAEAAYDEARKQIDAVREAVPRTYRIPGEQIECGVRNLASAHDTALKVNAELSGHIGTMRGQLAAAQAATVAAEGRAETAKKRASSLEDALAKTRTDLERVQSELAETNALLNKAIDSAETPS